MEDVAAHSEERAPGHDEAQQYRMLVEQSPLGILVNLDGRLAFVNPAAVRLLGARSPADLIGCDVFDIVHPDFHAMVRARMVGQLERGELLPPVEQQYRRLDGSYLDVKTTTAAVPFRGRNAIQVVFQDITAFKANENALKDSEAQYRFLVDNSPMAVLVHSEGIIQYANDACLKMYGARSRKDLVGTAVMERVHPDFRSVVEERLRLMRDRQQPLTSIEQKFIRVDGQVIDVKTVSCPVVFNGRPSYLAIGQDITQQKRAEAELRLSERRLVKAQQIARMGSFAIAGPGRDYWSHGLHQLLGLAPGTVPPSLEAYTSFIAPEERPGVERELRQALAEGRPFHSQHQVVRPDGSQRDFRLEVVPLPGADGAPAALEGVVIDETERMAVERMKNEFISIASHELRTPLTAMLGSIKLMAHGAGGELSPKFRKLIDVALRNAERLGRLINDILALEKIQSGQVILELAPCPVDSLFEEVCELMGAFALEHQVALRTEPGAAVVLADRDWILQVLNNLVNNAIKFSPPGSEIHLRAETEDAKVRLEVRDRGRGIPVEAQQTIFERFRQVNSADSRERGGTGLGLAICQSIVQQHHGTIGVESELGKGSRFYFTLESALAGPGPSRTP